MLDPTPAQEAFLRHFLREWRHGEPCGIEPGWRTALLRLYGDGLTTDAMDQLVAHAKVNGDRQTAFRRFTTSAFYATRKVAA